MASPLIDFISVEGFKSISSIRELTLRPINVVIGPNGAGKSNLIGVFAFLHAIREGGLQNYVRRAGGADQLLHFGSKVTSQIRIEVSFCGGKNQYLIELQPTEDDNLYPATEIVRFWDKAAHPRPWSESLSSLDSGREAGISAARLTRTPGWVRERLGSWRIFHVHDTSGTSPLRKTNQTNDNQYLRADGSNLASFLYLLQRKHPDAYEFIRKTTQQAAPFFDDFFLRPDAINEDTIRLAWRRRGSDRYFGAAALSDGTVRFIALATLLLQPQQYCPSVVLVDEPELGLHPYAIGLLASLIRQASTHTQVIASTQSSLLLDYFEPDDVLVASDVQNGTQLERLDGSKYAAWLEEYSLGQLWEKNEIGGRPFRNAS